MMKTQDQTDIPRTRQTIETVATKFNIYFTLSMAMCGAVLFFVEFAITQADFLKTLPDAGIIMAVGMFAFCLFFPWFTALYFARHLLLSVKKIEKELQHIRHKQEKTEPEY